jgi:CheY-like chemotaxis protein
MRQILLVDDSDSDAMLLERALRMAGIANPIQRAISGADAIAFLNTIQTAAATAIPVPLGIVFIDLKLPDKSGFDILKLMQSRTVFEDTLKVVVSSIDDMENIKRAYGLGADSFIAKPANQFDLKELLRSFPDHWYLVDLTSPPPPQAAKASEAPDPYDEAIHVWAKHREIIRALRHNLQVLRNQIADNDETFAIIETLTEELRNEIDPTGKNRPKKKPRNNLLF